MSARPPSDDYLAWSTWLSDHRPRRLWQGEDVSWAREPFTASAQRFATGTAVNVPDGRGSGRGPTRRRRTGVRSVINEDGNEYRAYLIRPTAGASKNLLFIRALEALGDLQLTQGDVSNLTRHAVDGKRQREIRLVERPGSVMQMTVTYRRAGHGSVRLGYTNGAITSPKIDLGDSDALFVQLAEFTGIEAKLESGETVDAAEVHRMTSSGRLVDIEAEGPW